MKIQGQRDPIAVTMINSGDLVVQWGVPLSAAGEASKPSWPTSRRSTKKGATC